VAFCGLERRENARRSDTILPTRDVSLTIWKDTCDTPHPVGRDSIVLDIRCTSIERLSTPERGL